MAAAPEPPTVGTRAVSLRRVFIEADARGDMLARQPGNYVAACAMHATETPKITESPLRKLLTAVPGGVVKSL